MAKELLSLFILFFIGAPIFASQNYTEDSAVDLNYSNESLPESGNITLDEGQHEIITIPENTIVIKVPMEVKMPDGVESNLTEAKLLSENNFTENLSADEEANMSLEPKTPAASAENETTEVPEEAELTEENGVLEHISPLSAMLEIIASSLGIGTDYAINLFTIGLAGSHSEGGVYSARTHLTAMQAGSLHGYGSVYSANIGFLGGYSSALTINSIKISPAAIVQGDDVNIYLSAAGHNFLWANITLPNGTVDTRVLLNRQNTTYSNTELTGRYYVSFYAKNSLGEVVNQSGYFDVFAPATINLSIIDSSGSGLNSTVSIGYRNDTLSEASSENGSFQIDTVQASVDIIVSSYGDGLQLTLRNISMDDETGALGLDKTGELDGYKTVYAVSNNFSFSQAELIVCYGDLAYSDEANLKLNKCNGWDFASRTCPDGWIDITSAAVKNTATKCFEYVTSSFSGFGIREDIPASGRRKKQLSEKINVYLGETIIDKSEGLVAWVSAGNISGEQIPITIIWEIYSLGGSKVYEKTSSANLSENRAFEDRLDVSNLSAGKYVLKAAIALPSEEPADRTLEFEIREVSPGSALDNMSNGSLETSIPVEIETSALPENDTINTAKEVNGTVTQNTTQSDEKKDSPHTDQNLLHLAAILIAAALIAIAFFRKKEKAGKYNLPNRNPR